MSYTITRTSKLNVIYCCNCHVEFAMPAEMDAECLADNTRYFYCPNGHSQHYTGPTEAQKLRTQLDSEKYWREHYEREYANADERFRSERASHSNTKGQLTKARNKVKKAERGVCVHCHRSFANVQRHVENKHPEVLKTPAGKT